MEKCLFSKKERYPAKKADITASGAGHLWKLVNK
jgi:predicted Mrr-cat superfamily restriction endonuclease